MPKKKQTQKKSEIKVYLIITDFQCHPEEITKILDIRPTETWLQGDLIPKTIMRYKQNGWQLNSPIMERGTQEEQTEALFEFINPSLNKFKNLPEKTEIGLNCVIYSKEAQGPALGFSTSVIQKLAQINAYIDVDLYCLS